MTLFATRKSYSIEAEDLLLETIFCNVLKFYKRGTYIDIGAAHPIEHSNTYFFYERGWRGICVEPNPEFFSLYQSLRPDDRALNIGVAEQSGNLEYHRFSQPLINGFFGQDLVDRQIANGENYLGSTSVPCLSVSEFLEKEIADKQIELLNIDVETLDARLLGIWNWDVCRPKVICAEIHTKSIETMLNSDVAIVMKRAGYTPMSRGWLSTIFVANELMNYNV
jgi:FkbM family methyltransferase